MPVTGSRIRDEFYNHRAPLFFASTCWGLILFGVYGFSPWSVFGMPAPVGIASWLAYGVMLLHFGTCVAILLRSSTRASGVVPVVQLFSFAIVYTFVWIMLGMAIFTVFINFPRAILWG